MSPDTVIQMDIGTVFALLGGLISVLLFGPVVWILKSALSDLKSLRQDASNFREYAHKEFVRKTDYEKALQEIKELLNRIFDKLDGKADK